jgi:hypothetical protein
MKDRRRIRRICGGSAEIRLDPPEWADAQILVTAASYHYPKSINNELKFYI